VRDLAKLVLLAIGGACNVSDSSRVNTSTSFSSFQALLKLTCGTTVKAKEISLNFSIPLCWKPFFAWRIMVVLYEASVPHYSYLHNSDGSSCIIGFIIKMF
jgi:hypothetical protein